MVWFGEETDLEISMTFRCLSCGGEVHINPVVEEPILQDEQMKVIAAEVVFKGYCAGCRQTVKAGVLAIR